MVTLGHQTNNLVEQIHISHFVFMTNEISIIYYMQPIEDLEREQLNWNYWHFQLPKSRKMATYTWCSMWTPSRICNSSHVRSCQSFRCWFTWRDCWWKLEWRLCTLFFRFRSQIFLPFLLNILFLLPKNKTPFFFSQTQQSYFAGSLSKMPEKGSFEVSLGILKCEIFTVSPIRVGHSWFSNSELGFFIYKVVVSERWIADEQVLGENIQFAPIGLVDMFNSGGAIKSLDCKKDSSGFMAKIQVRGCGRFGAYSNRKPKSCAVDKKEKQFIYNAKEGLLTFKLNGGCNDKDIQIFYWQYLSATDPEGSCIYYVLLLPLLFHLFHFLCWRVWYFFNSKDI